jgi:hypothetical protein
MEWSDKGQDNLLQAKRLHTTAIDHYRHHDLPRATHNMTEALRLRRAVLPESHPQVVASEEFLINLYHQQGLHAPQATHLRRLLAMKKKRFGRFHVETEQTMTQLADLLQTLGEKEEAEQLAAEVWRMRAMPSTQRQASDFDDALGNLGNTNVRRTDPKRLIDHFFGGGGEPKIRSSPFADDATWFKNLKERLALQKQTEQMFHSSQNESRPTTADDSAPATLPSPSPAEVSSPTAAEHSAGASGRDNPSDTRDVGSFDAPAIGASQVSAAAVPQNDEPVES